MTGKPLFLHVCRTIERLGHAVRRRSSVWQSPAWPDPHEPAYCNAVISIDPRGLSPAHLLGKLLAVEARYGRRRGARNAARTLDLDLIAYGGVVKGWADGQPTPQAEVEPSPVSRALAPLIVPHPRAHQRVFVLEPLAELAPDWVHPANGAGIADLLTACRGRWPIENLGPMKTP